MAQLVVLGRDLKSLLRCKILVWFVQYVVTAGNWLRPSFICSAFAELRPDVFYRDLFFQLQVDLWSQHEFFVVTMLVVSTESSG